MVRRRFRTNELTKLALAGAALLWVGSYMFPFGYAESFKWFMDNWFAGDYSKTTWFFYAWTSVAILGGGLILMYATGTKPKRLLKQIF